MITYFNVCSSFLQHSQTSITDTNSASARSFDPRGTMPFSCCKARRLLTASFTAGNSTSCRSSTQSLTASSCVRGSVNSVYASEPATAFT